MATMTPKDIVVAVRQENGLEDEARWPDALLVDLLYTGMLDLARARVGILLDATGVTLTAVAKPATSAMLTALSLADDWKEALVAWVAWKAFMKESNVENNVKRAAYYKAEYARIKAGK